MDKRELTSELDAAQGMRRLVLTEDDTELEIVITLREDTALYDEAPDLQVTGNIPSNHSLGRSLADLVADLLITPGSRLPKMEEVRRGR